MSEKSIAYNKFDPRTTKIVYIHDGKFHADDMMFAALATVAADRARNKIEVIRVSSVPPNIDLMLSLAILDSVFMTIMRMWMV